MRYIGEIIEQIEMTEGKQAKLDAIVKGIKENNHFKEYLEFIYSPEYPDSEQSSLIRRADLPVVEIRNRNPYGLSPQNLMNQSVKNYIRNYIDPKKSARALQAPNFRKRFLQQYDMLPQNEAEIMVGIITRTYKLDLIEWDDLLTIRV